MNSFSESELQINKEELTKLADEARGKINKNRYLLDMINIFKQQILFVKNLITILSCNKNNNYSSKYKDILNYKEQIYLLNKNLKEEYGKILKKQNNFNNNISNNIFDEDLILTQTSENNFILHNTIMKLDSIIANLNDNIESSKKFDIFREPKRENDIDIKESKLTFYVYNLDCQQKMLSYCRGYSLYRYRNKKKANLIEKYQNKISLLKEYIKFFTKQLYGDEKIKYKNKNDKNKFLDIKKRIGINTFNSKGQFKVDYKKYLIPDNEEGNGINSFNKTLQINKNDDILFKNIYKTEEKTKKVEERKKINLLKIDELLDIDNIEVENEEIINNELNSDQETYFENKVKSKKKISKDFLQNIKKDIPKINLSQIEFNKLKVINEADSYSLQKRNFEQNNINGKIKNMKMQIKSLTRKIINNRKKLRVIHDFIEDVKYNYKLYRPIKVQSSAAGNPVHYIREKLLNIVEETIHKAETKEKTTTCSKDKTPKTGIEEGGENEEELVGSDYSDEDIYMDNFGKKRKDNELNKKINKDNKRNIKTNLISQFNSNDKEDDYKKNNNQELNEDLKIKFFHSGAQSK